MRKLTATEKLRAVNEGSMTKKEFVRQMRQTFPQNITQFNGFNDSVQILKNKGLLFETAQTPKDDSNVHYGFSDEAIRRGTRIEMNVLGHATFEFDTPDETVQKAKDLAIKNLRKDPLHYLNLLAGESSKVDKNDQSKEVKRGAKDVDSFNGLKKAALKEGYTEAQIEAAIQTIKEKKLFEAEPIPTEPGIDGERTVNHDRKMAMRKIIDALTIVGDEKGFKVNLDQALEFIKTHKDDIFKGDIDASDEADIWWNYNEYELHNSKDGWYDTDIQAEAMSDEEMDNIKNYGKGQEETPYRLGDKFSTNFDYEGMLKMGLKIRINTPVDKLEQLFSSFEDVNYHTEGSCLSYMIDSIQDGDKDDALEHLKKFRAEIKKTLGSLFEGIFPVREAEEGYIPKADRLRESKRSSSYGKLAEGRRKKTQGGKVVTENDYETGGYVESMGPNFDRGVNLLIKAWEEWKMGPMTEPGMIEFAKKDVLNYLETQFMVENLEEEKGTDHDEDGDIDGDDYMASKDKAIKSAMGKNESMVKTNIKAIIAKVLEEQIVNEAATAELANWGESYNDFNGVKAVVHDLENIVTEIESFYDKIGDKISKTFAKTSEFTNEEGLKIGAFIAPSLEAAFKKDLRPVTKRGFLNKTELPKVRTVSQAEIDAHNSGQKPLGETEIEEQPKQTIYTPNI